MDKAYWSAHTDTRKTALMCARDIWKVLIGIAAGCVLGALICLAYHAAADSIMYSARSEFYIDFTIGVDGEAAYDYYNGYTWNDLMTTDLVASYTLDKLAGTGVDLAVLEQDTTAEILSDIRLLIVTIRDTDPDRCAAIQEATEYALTSLGEDAKEFDAISVIKSQLPEREIADRRLMQAILLGAILGCLAAILAIAYTRVLDDSITVPGDVAQTGLKVLAVRTAKSDEKLESRLNARFSSEAGAQGTSDEETPGVTYIDGSAYSDLTSDLPAAEGSVIIRVPYRRMTGSALNLLAERLRESGCDIRGVIITDADAGFYRLYYGFGSADRG